jgi:hypothetical protein
MNLRGTLRKAAGLLIELPEEPELPEEEPQNTPERRAAQSEVKRVVESGSNPSHAAAANRAPNSQR